jgi:hypothetical protein
VPVLPAYKSYLKPLHIPPSVKTLPLPQAKWFFYSSNAHGFRLLLSPRILATNPDPLDSHKDVYQEAIQH